MAIDNSDEIEQSASVLAREIEKLEGLGLAFAASVVRIALLDLQMHLHGVTQDEFDQMSTAASVAEIKRLASERLGKNTGGEDNG